MTLKVAINGFGRIGRSAMRMIIESYSDKIDIVALNASGGAAANEHLLKYDSVHGRFQKPVEVDGENLKIDGKPVRLTGERDPANIDWDGIDVVLECTGAFSSKEKSMAHINSGAKRVLVSAVAKNADKTVVYGVNQHVLDGGDQVISTGSCTTNCLAPVAMVLHNAIGIEKGFMSTIHSYTGDQPTLDRRHRDPYRGRAAAMSIIPTTTGAARAVGLVLPELLGKLDGGAIRVPTPNVSLVDLNFNASRKTTIEEINAAIKEAAEGPLKGIMAYDEEETVSVDYNHTTTASNFAGRQTRVMHGDLARIFSWYDNEWGFTNQMLKTVLAIGETL